MQKWIRIGQVSKIDYERGMIRVVYHEMDDTVTALIPYLTLGGEYHMPEVEDYVAVLHMSNGMEAGFILGKFWTKKHKPPVFGKDLYRKDFSNTVGKAYFQRDPEAQKTELKTDGTLVLDADSISFKTNSGTVTVAEIISHIRSGHA